MEKEFIPYEQALALKELGFDEKCGACYYKKFDNEIGYHKVYRDFNFVQLTVSAPTFSQAFRWFREKYLLSYSIRLTDNSSFYFFKFIIYDSKNRHYNDEDCWDSCGLIYDIKEYSTYEEAELECLKKLIEIVKEKY